MSKTMRRAVTVLIAAVAIGVTGWLAVRWSNAAKNRLEVTNAGPLDIRLWGIRPNAGDVIYDTNGKEISRTLGTAMDDPRWSSSYRQIDLIFELPKIDEVPLFRKSALINVSGEDRIEPGMGGVRPVNSSLAQRIFEFGGKRLLWLRTGLNRTFKRSVLGGRWTYEDDVDSIDITLEYFYGAAGKSVFTLKGPFEPNSTLSSPDGVCDVSFTRDAADYVEYYSLFEQSTSTRFDPSRAVVVYDMSGERHLTDLGNAMGGSEGSRFEYKVVGVSLANISAIAFGEQPHRITFENINLRAGGVERRSHAAYLDEMAAKLNLKLTPDKLAYYRFHSGREAVEVINIVRGRHIAHATEAIFYDGKTSGIMRIAPLTLNEEQKRKLKGAISRWLSAWDPAIRAGAIRLGLLYDWPEFVEPALEFVKQAATKYDFSGQAALQSVADALAKYSDKLSDEEIGRVKEILLSHDDWLILDGLRTCLGRTKSQAKADALRELAMDERPWLWWYATEKLAKWGEFEGKYDSLPDELKVRLFAVMGPEGFSNAEQIAPRANELLAEIVTPKLVELDSPTVFRIIEKIAANPDRRFATTALIDYLRRFQGLYLSPAYPVGKTVKYINLWYGLDIGGLGSDVNRQVLDSHKYDWPAITAEAIEWYDSMQGANDADSGGRAG